MSGIAASKSIGDAIQPTVRHVAWRKAASSVLGQLRSALRIRRPAVPATNVAPRATAVYVGNNRLLVGTRIGKQRYAFYVEADDRLLTPWFALTGCHESDVTDFFLRSLRPDSHCIDVGSNFGYFLCLMARTSTAGRILAIEPDPELASLAQDNLFLNGVHDRAEVVCAAASDRLGSLTLHRREFRSGNTSIVEVDSVATDYFNEPPARAFTVPSLTIDELADRLGGGVDFLKIDVEGAEPLVLAGAAHTISSNPNIAIVMEWSPGQILSAGFSISTFVQQILDLGLACFLLTRDGEKPFPATALETQPYQSAIILRRANAA